MSKTLPDLFFSRTSESSCKTPRYLALILAGAIPLGGCGIATVAVALAAPRVLAQTPAPGDPPETPPQTPPEAPPETVPEAAPSDPEVIPEAAPETAPSNPEFVTICAFDPAQGTPNPLGMRAFITASEVEGDSVFRYEQFASVVADSENPGRPADITNQRTLTLYDTPLAEARQLLIDSPAYYAELLGLGSVEELGDDSFSAVNDTLSCQEVSDRNMANVPQPAPRRPDPSPGASPPPATPPATPPANSPPASGTPASPPLADLPDGNYRVVSAEFPNRVVSDEELLEAGGTIFTFRKKGDQVIGTFGYIDSEIGACLSGTLSGNAVTGQAYTNDEPVTAEGGSFLGPGRYLQLGEAAEGERYDNSTLNLSGFSRINAGSRLPVESCP